MFNRILVPLDGSPASETVLRHVAQMADGGTAEVVLLTVVPNVKPHQQVKAHPGEMQHVAGQFAVIPLQDMHYDVQGESRGQEIDAVKDEADVYLTERSQPFIESGITVGRHVVVGDNPAEAIADYAKTGGFDTIALATHGREGISRLMSGSVAEKVMKLSGLPVVMVYAGG